MKELLTGQDKAEQAVRKAQNLPALQKGLERLKNDRTWQSVADVDAFIDELIAICEKIG